MQQSLPHTDYRLLITELIQKQMAVFGPEVALKSASKIGSIIVDQAGKVIEIAGDPKLSLTNLLTLFQNLSKITTEKSLTPILKKYGQEV